MKGKLTRTKTLQIPPDKTIAHWNSRPTNARGAEHQQLLERSRASPRLGEATEKMEHDEACLES